MVAREKLSHKTKITDDLKQYGVVMSVDKERDATDQAVAQDQESCATTFDEILGRMKLAVGVKSDTAFAKAMGFSQSSISGAKERQSIPPAWAIQLAERFDISVDWIWFGKGRMKPGGGAMFRPAKLPSPYMEGHQGEGSTHQAGALDVAPQESVDIDRERTDIAITEGAYMGEQNEESVKDDEPVLIYNDKGEAFDLGEALAHAVSVLTSKTTYASALLSDINAFHEAVWMAKKVDELHVQARKSASSIQAYFNKSDELVEDLRSENKRLQGEIDRISQQKA